MTSEVGPHPEGDVGQAAGDGVAWDAFGAAAVAERIVGGGPASDPGVGLLKVLAGGGQAQGVQAAEGREVRGLEGRMVHCRGLSKAVVW